MSKSHSIHNPYRSIKSYNYTTVRLRQSSKLIDYKPIVKTEIYLAKTPLEVPDCADARYRPFINFAAISAALFPCGLKFPF